VHSALEAQIQKITTLSTLQQLCECYLSSEISNGEKLVFGEGPSQAEIMLIGEAPGVQEAKTGRPFVGSAGKLLTKLLNEIGLRREQIYIGNVLKTHPPGNRKPYRGEVKKELPFLHRQIELIQPKLLVLLGATALQALTSPKTKLTQLRGSWIEVAGIPALVTYHPAAALRDKTKEAVLRQDFILLRDYLTLGA
jgi:uracil-DNA glycosylase